MEIGIITYHFPLNYGAVLQVYALSRVLENLGHDVKIIDYQPISHVRRYNWSWNRLGCNGQNLRNLKLSKKFACFRKSYLKMTKLYQTQEQLKADPPDFDVFISGSDQVWNQTAFGKNTPYFLDFAPKGTRRVSYSASFGKSQVDDRFRSELKVLLNNIDHISVREKSGCDIIKELTNRQSTCVLDPTLLLDDYNDIISPVPEKNYILVKSMQSTPMFDSIVNYVSRLTGLQVIYLYSMSIKFWKFIGKKRVYPDPSSYLGYFKNAKYVITDSFHGTAFCLNFKKRFLSVSLPPDPTKDTSVRMTDLLSSVGLSKRFVDSCDEVNIKRIIESDINWGSVNSSLSNLREKSMNFLTSVLK